MSPEKRPIEIGKEPEQTRLNRWIEQGFDDQAVALYGAQAGVLQRILSTGQVSASSPELATLSYQKVLMREHKYLYYLIPFVDRIAAVDPKIARQVIRRFPGSSLQDLHYNLQPQNIRKLGKIYALHQSIRASFYEMTGVTAGVHDILVLARRILPNKFSQFTQDVVDYASTLTDIDELERNKDEKVQRAIRNGLSAQQRAKVLSSVLDKRGVLIYFNKGIFAKHKTIPCPEIEDEIILVGNEPLTQEVISGVEVLSDSDKRVLNVD